VGTNVNGTTFYVDFDSIRKRGGYVYFWYLNDFLKLPKSGSLSAKIYSQGDCKTLRWKVLSGSFHKEPMGGGTGEVSEPPAKDKGWKYPPPKTALGTVLKTVCQYAR